MSFFSKSSGILGMNARNLIYLTKNAGARKKLADDKIYSKRFLQARGIGASRLYASLKSLQELRSFNPKTLPKSFVIKPNKGYGGEGIITIKNTKNDTYITPGNVTYSWEDLAQHCTAILDGKFAISGFGDKVIFEELLQPHEFFDKYIEYGLPDIRIIVYKYVPIIAMLRLPTHDSHGKANLHIGAVGLGIDIGTGKTTYGVLYNKFIRKLPTGQTVSSLIIPQWDDILMTASKTQLISQIGYLAVDIALTNRGIKIIELNARAGIAIQIANQALLRKRLDKVADLKVASPNEGVRLGKTLFTRIIKKTVSQEVKPKPILGLYEYINLLNITPNPILAKIDPHSDKNYLDINIAKNILTRLTTTVIRDRKIKLPYIAKDFSDTNYKIILSGRQLTDFLIDASKTVPEYRVSSAAETKEEKIIQNIDTKIHNINSQIAILSRLKPINLAEQQKIFLKNPKQSPQFIYKKPDLDIENLKKELKKIPRGINHPLMPIFSKKIEEVDNKLSFIDLLGQIEAMDYSKKLYGAVNERQYESAINFLDNERFAEDTSKILRLENIISQTSKFLSDHHLNRWRIKVLDHATSGMQINKKNTIFISKKSKISENRLKALFEHEIKTHIYRLENGRLQKYKILEQGTADYLLTEEGLAIFNQNKLGIPLGNKFLRPAINVIAIYLGQQMSFAELWHHLMDTLHLDKLKAWWICVRTKRGLQDTGQPGSFTKDRVYFQGHQIISQLVKDKGLNELKKLYIGKIGISDMKYLGDIRQWPIKYLPDYLK